MDYSVKIGLAPMRRDVTPRPGIFNWEFAEKRGREISNKIEQKYTVPGKVEFVNLKGIHPVDVMFCEEDADRVIERFTAEKVDAVFIINANFGNEEIAARIARTLNKPVLIWAPLDDTFMPDGTRYTDSQCGLFGVSRQLQRCNVPFTYMPSCKVCDETFDTHFSRFVSVACMVKNFKGARIGQVGLRPKPFCSVIFNEGELLQKFGINTIPINLAVVLDKYNRILETRDDELEKGKQLLLSRYEMDDLTPPLLKKVYAFVLLYQELFDEYKLDAVSAECWTAMQLLVGAMPCTAYSVLADMGYIIGCESDMHGTISMMLLSAASLGEKKPFFGEFTVRHPENKNGELLWHCGPFAYSLKDPDSKAKQVNMRQWFKVKDGGYTICRFEQDNGDYTLINGKFSTTDGPYTFGTYLWAQFDDLAKWEKKLVEGPYIHHMAEIEGDYTAELTEFCKYIDNLRIDTVD